MAFPGCFSGTVQSAGKIVTDDGMELAVKANSCTDGKILKPGDKVQFDLVEGSAEGSTEAGNISGGTGTAGGASWGAAGGGWGAGSWGAPAKGGKDKGGKGGKDGGKGGKDGGKDKGDVAPGVRRSGKKMKMCMHFEQGTCQKAMCTFAHSQEEIGTFYDLASAHVATGKMTGTVKTFTPDKGFGFLDSSDGQSYFFHQKQFVDGTSPVEGDWLTHDLEPSPLKPGQNQASNISGGTGLFLGIKQPKGKGKDGKGKGKGKDSKGKGKAFGGVVLPGAKGKDGGKGGKDDGKSGPRLTGKKHQMCTHFPLGTCRKMDMCTFAHTEAEIGTSYDHSGGAGGYGAAPKGGGKGAAGPYSW